MKRQKIQLKDIMSQHSDMEYQQLYAYARRHEKSCGQRVWKR